MRTIVLTGMMGSGKSTVGKLLSENLGIQFVDLDVFIEQSENLSISEIFKQKGEKYFRQIEKDKILEIFNENNQVISLGGGAFEDDNIRKFLLKNSCVIYLKTSPQKIFERIKNDTTRPLLSGEMSISKINEILDVREKNYNSAEKIILTDEKEPNLVVDEILGVLEL
jgi:shikimate kinase